MLILFLIALVSRFADREGAGVRERCRGPNSLAAEYSVFSLDDLPGGFGNFGEDIFVFLCIESFLINTYLSLRLCVGEEQTRR